MRIRNFLLFALVSIFLFMNCENQTEDIWILSAPAQSHYTNINTHGTSVIPNGRLISPRGLQREVAPHPYGLTLSPDGSVAVTANSGVAPFSISIIRDVFGENPSVQQIPPGARNERGVLAAVFMGLAISPDNQKLYVGGGQEGKVFIFDLSNGDKLGELVCDTPFNKKEYEDSYIGDLVLSKNGNTLFAVDQTNFRVIAIDMQTEKIVSSISVGRYPFGITLSPDDTRAYVANVGMFEYSRIIDTIKEDPERTGLDFPPFAYASKEAKEGVKIDGWDVPGLGDPNVPESFSVWEIDIKDLKNAKVTARVKTGILVGQVVEDFPAVGGASPNSVVATHNRVFVSNGNNDSISVIDTQIDKIIDTIELKIDPRLGNLRGAIPFGLALSPDSQRLYVAEAGINAVAVIDVSTHSVLGHIPTAWFPSKLAVSTDGKKLIVAMLKDLGVGPTEGRRLNPAPKEVTSETL